MGEYELNIAKEPGVFNVGIVRFHNLYGDRINYGPNRSQALPSLVRKAIMHPKESLSLWGSGKQYRDFLHVSDAVNGILATIERGMNKGAVQIGTGVATSLEDAASEISYLAKKLLNKDVNFIPDRTKMEGDMGRVADLTRARDILKWKAQISFKQGMESMFRWILQDMGFGPPTEFPVSPMQPQLVKLHAKQSEVLDPRKFNMTAKLNLWLHSETGYLGN